MNKRAADRIRELELEVARLNGVIEGMRQARQLLSQPATLPWPSPAPDWHWGTRYPITITPGGPLEPQTSTVWCGSLRHYSQ